MRRMGMNRDPKRDSYDLLSNSCLHFMKYVAEAGGALMPTVIAPQPAGYIVQVRLQHRDLNYDTSAGLVVDDTPLD